MTFDNSFIRELPGDPETENFRRQVPNACYSRVQPAAFKAPQLVAYAREVAEDIGLDESYCRSQEFVDVFSGQKLLPGMEPHAMCYGGHQFGNWAGQLGDGRAIVLGEVINPNGERRALQLKGAGPTPYSRGADGLAVLRSSVREFLCSEAMYHLGVPTTRALSLVTTGEQVMRDMFYDGRPEWEPGAIVCRVAPSFIRLGNFELPASRGENHVLKQLADYTIRTYFSHLLPESGELSKDVYLNWFREICRTTADMIVHWMRVGFVHGVMNTDNLSIHGITIDYGPYGWLDDFNPNWTPNTTDAQGRRYRYANQPGIAQWNLLQMANAIYPLIEDSEALQEILVDFGHTYTTAWRAMMARKLGLQSFRPEGDEELITELEEILPLVETDMTIFYRQLAQLSANTNADTKDDELIAPFQPAFYQPDQLTPDYINRLAAWSRQYIQRLQQDNVNDEERRAQMNRVNPKYVLRNYIAQLAIDDAEQGDYTKVWELLDVLRKPYEEQPGFEKWAEKRPEWARERAGCSMLSCSS